MIQLKRGSLESLTIENPVLEDGQVALVKSIYIYNETSDTYTTAKTRMDMSGTQYRCVVKNSIGEVTSDAATLTVTAIPTYTITVQTDGHGTASATPTSAKAGDQITLTATPNSGYRFSGWTSSDNITFANAGSAQTTFTMQDKAVTITANWKKKSSGSSYSLTEGIPRDEEKEPEKTENEKPEDEKPENTETIIPSARFNDVGIFDWYYEGVTYVSEKGLMSGMGDGAFAPNTALSREMMGTILWNMAGKPEANDVAPFLEVTSDKYYAEAIAWANENGIVAGFGDTFGVGQTITREQFAVMLYNYAVFKGYDTTQGGMAIREFTDFEKISDYAVTAMTWAVNNGIIGGYEDGSLRPQGGATRAEAASMLMNFCKNADK